MKAEQHAFSWRSQVSNTSKTGKKRQHRRGGRQEKQFQKQLGRPTLTLNHIGKDNKMGIPSQNDVAKAIQPRGVSPSLPTIFTQKGELPCPWMREATYDLRIDENANSPSDHSGKWLRIIPRKLREGSAGCDASGIETQPAGCWLLNGRLHLGLHRVVNTQPKGTAPTASLPYSSLGDVEPPAEGDDIIAPPLGFCDHSIRTVRRTTSSSCTSRCFSSTRG
jgi:hypothetical protein